MNNSFDSRDEIIKEIKSKKFDIVVIGGGIYGIMLSLEAVRRGKKVLVLEKNDFGSGTSFNHLRTVHGGLRYLQNLDILRFFESVTERKWFLKIFPSFVKPVGCIMPLYNKGLKRTLIMYAALKINDILSFFRNSGLKENSKIKNGFMKNKEYVRQKINYVDSEGLKSGAVWFDAIVFEYQRLYLEIINKVKRKGGIFLNYAEVKDLISEDGKIKGVIFRDNVEKTNNKIYSEVVINSTGPWSRELSAKFHKDYKKLLKKKLLLWNILFNVPAISEYAVAVSPDKGKGHTYFLHSLKGMLLAGTGEEIVDFSPDNITVKNEYIEHFISDLNKALPGINLKKDDILIIYKGILPAEENGKLSSREVIIDHSKDGLKGLFSVSGVKFTTSRRVAEKVMKRIFREKPIYKYEEIFNNVEEQNIFFDFNEIPSNDKLNKIKDIIKKENVVYLSDLIFRRTSLGDNPVRVEKFLDSLRGCFESWDENKWGKEVKDLQKTMEEMKNG